MVASLLALVLSTLEQKDCLRVLVVLRRCKQSLVLQCLIRSAVTCSAMFDRQNMPLYDAC